MVYITPPDSTAGDIDDDEKEEESLEAVSQASSLLSPNTSSTGVDPFTNSAVDLNPQMGYYLHYCMFKVEPMHRVSTS